MELTGDPSYRIWPLPYAADRKEPGLEGVYPQGPQIDSRTLFRIRLHCQFANPGSHCAIMFISQGISERLHVAIQNPSFDVIDLIPKIIKPEQFPEDWFPLFHVQDLPQMFFDLNLNYKYLRQDDQVVYLNLNLLSEPINHAAIYYQYGKDFLAFLKLIESRGLIKTNNRDFVANWQLRPATSSLLPEAEVYLANFNDLYLPRINLSSFFLLARLRGEPYYYLLGCSPVYMHFVALFWASSKPKTKTNLLWLVEGHIELSMKRLEDYAQLNLIQSALLSASGSVYRQAANLKLPSVKEPISEAFYYLGPEKIKVQSLLYPPNQVPVELF